MKVLNSGGGIGWLPGQRQASVPNPSTRWSATSRLDLHARLNGERKPTSKRAELAQLTRPQAMSSMYIEVAASPVRALDGATAVELSEIDVGNPTSFACVGIPIGPSHA